MFQNPRGINPLNWQLLIDETLKRRKSEKLTQREHAALAGVSIPTIAAFDRGEMTLSLVKAFDILRVVGLIDEQVEGNAQEAFVREAFNRWCVLTDRLPKDSPGRFPHGWFRFDYCFEGNLKFTDLKTFKKILEAPFPAYTGWPPFLIVTNRPSKFTPNEVDGLLECWIQSQKNGLPEAPYNDAAHSDFWRADPAGRMFLIRGYHEDGVETFSSGSVFDTILPIWRMGEVLLHAEHLASFLQKDPNKPLTIRFRALYSGLNGRVLRAWANPLSNILFEEHVARNDEAVLEAVIPAKNLSARLSEHLYPLVSSLYERFGVIKLSESLVQAEVERLLSKKDTF